VSFDRPSPSSEICPWCGNHVNPSMSSRWDRTPWLGDRVMHFACIESIEQAARTITHNLAIGAALFRAYTLGYLLGMETPYLMGDEDPSEWMPGRGKPAP
jgi:hypothetical protein